MTFYSQQRPVIEAGRLVLISNGGSRELIGIRSARQQLATLETKADLRKSTIDRRELLRDAVATWERYKASKA